MSLSKERRQIAFRLQSILKEKVEKGELDFYVTASDRVAIVAYECLTKNGYDVEVLPGRVRIKVPPHFVKTKPARQSPSSQEKFYIVGGSVAALCILCYWVITSLLHL